MWVLRLTSSWLKLFTLDHSLLHSFSTSNHEPLKIVLQKETFCKEEIHICEWNQLSLMPTGLGEFET